MELAEVVSKLFELQQLNSRRHELVLDITQGSLSERYHDMMTELRHHRSLDHGQRVGTTSESDLRYWAEQRADTRDARREYREICSRIIGIESALKAHFDSTGLAA